MTADLLEELRRAILDLDMDAATATVESIIGGDGEVTTGEAVDAVAAALEVVGRRFQEGEWFVGELVYAGEITRAALDRLVPSLAAGAREPRGVVVVGTVAGDMHDLGKNIFANYAKGAGFTVIDLGVNVSTGRFAAAVAERAPLALGMSCLLTVTTGAVAAVIEELKRRGSRDRVKVIIGGAALTERFAAEVGAEAFAPDAVTGTDIVKAWSGS